MVLIQSSFDISALSIIFVIFAALMSLSIAIILMLYIYKKILELTGMENSRFNFLRNTGMKAITFMLGISLAAVFLSAAFITPASASTNALGLNTQYEGFNDTQVAVQASGLSAGTDYVVWHSSDGETTNYYRLFTATSSTYNWHFNPGADSDGSVVVGLDTYNGTVPNQAELPAGFNATEQTNRVVAYLPTISVSSQADIDPLIAVAVVVLVIGLVAVIAKGLG